MLAGLALIVCTGLPTWACKVEQQTPISARLIYAICMVESHGNTLAYVANDAGSPSYGLCQVKEKTARWLGFKGDALELMKPEVNVLYCAKYLQYHLKRYHNLEQAISAFNAGHATDSNQDYVDKVMARMAAL